MGGEGIQYLKMGLSLNCVLSAEIDSLQSPATYSKTCRIPAVKTDNRKKAG